MSALRSSVRSFVNGISAGRRRSAALRRDRMARPNGGPAAEISALTSGIHPSNVSSMRAYR